MTLSSSEVFCLVEASPPQTEALAGRMSYAIIPSCPS